MRDILKEEVDASNVCKLREAYLGVFELMCKLRIRSEVDDRSFDLALECADEITEILAEYCSVIDDELTDCIFWEIDQESKLC